MCELEIYASKDEIKFAWSRKIPLQTTYVPNLWKGLMLLNRERQVMGNLIVKPTEVWWLCSVEKNKVMLLFSKIINLRITSYVLTTTCLQGKFLCDLVSWHLKWKISTEGIHMDTLGIVSLDQHEATYNIFQLVVNNCQVLTNKM